MAAILREGDRLRETKKSGARPDFYNAVLKRVST
jgi:hypothetical protein